MRRYPSFEIDAAPTTFAAIQSGLSGLTVGGRNKTDWLLDVDGNVYPIYVNQRDLEFKFEVFALAIPTLSALAARVAMWEPPDPPAGLPGAIRDALLKRPDIPAPPSRFDPWPFERWTVEVLRRSEFVVEDVEIQEAFGSAPNVQSAARPGHVPPEACAFCDVAVGLLFTGEAGAQLLIGADWMPFQTIVTRDASVIHAFSQACEAVRLDEYLDGE